MKKAYKALSVLMIVVMIVFACTNVFAVDIDTIMTQSKTAVSEDGATSMNKIGGTIIGYVTSAAMVIAVVMVAVLGIKYMMGSVEEKAEYKKSFMPLIIGAVLVFGASAVAKIIISLSSTFTNPAA